MKRILDFTLASLGLLILSPVLALAYLCVRAYDGGPALFRQERVGLGGRSFRMLKFRTMIIDAESKGSSLTVGRDSRITPVGRWLRATKVDELPQLWNVILGQMSFVGPRPEVEKYVADYSLEQRAVLNLKPGITDPASLAFYFESELLAQAKDPEEFYKKVLSAEKIRINLDYAARASLGKDMLVIIATVAKGFGIHFDIFKWFGLRAPNVRSLV